MTVRERDRERERERGHQKDERCPARRPLEHSDKALEGCRSFQFYSPEDPKGSLPVLLQ